MQADSDPRLRITVPATHVQLAPHGRTTVLLNASSHALGVHTVTLQLTDRDGTAARLDDPFPIRSNQVSNVIWLILGTGVALLFGAIVVRLSRRVRTAAARHGT